MTDRETIIEKAARAYAESTMPNTWPDGWVQSADIIRKHIEAALIAVGALPPKPAPTPGQRIAEGMVIAGPPQDTIDVEHPTDEDRVIRLRRHGGTTAGTIELLRQYIAAAIDHALATAPKPAPAVDVARLEKIAEEFIQPTARSHLLYIGGWLLEHQHCNGVIASAREKLVALMQKALGEEAK